MTEFCKTPECIWEAISAIVFVGAGEYLPVCQQCENAIHMFANRLSVDSYDIVIIPIEELEEARL